VSHIKPLSETIADFRETPIPAHRKPRAKPRRLEDAFHTSVAKYLSSVIARPGVCSPLGVTWFSIEPRAKRSLAEGARNKMRGVIPGIPDVAIFHAERAYFIELKSPTGTVSGMQTDLHLELARSRIPVLVARDLDSVAAVLHTWGIPHRRAVL
jgi:hypothetical protein